MTHPTDSGEPRSTVSAQASPGCAGFHRMTRRHWLRLSGLSGIAWLTPVAELLSRAAELSPAARPRSVILLWLAGGPSQLETFDPHPHHEIAAGSTGIDTRLPGVQLGSGLPRTAEVMDKIALIRNLVSKEGDHERATYNVKTGYRPDPTLTHPSLGSILCHQLPDAGTDIPRHVSILPGEWPARGGYLGDQYNAFLVGDPAAPPQDIRSPLDDPLRSENRYRDLQRVEAAFARQRLPNLDTQRTLHLETIRRARQMMSSEQVAAFELKEVPIAEREAFGDTPFGRGCLVAARLIQTGVRCVEVTLSGWDSHINNHETQAARCAQLDPAFAALIDYLHQRELLQETLVICGGEFGRTPTLNPAQGRDHWPHGFSMALAGGGLHVGQVLGETDPGGGKIPFDQGIPIADLHATVLHALGINHQLELMTPVQRPMKLTEGQPLSALTG